jgi:hypothetical protein
MIIERDDPDSAWVLEVFPRDQLSVWRSYLILHVTGDLAASEHGR